MTVSEFLQKIFSSAGETIMSQVGTPWSGRFPTTIWASVNDAAQADSEQALHALDGLLRRYYAPLLAHLCFKFRAGEEQAKDWLQEFMRLKVLHEQLLRRAERKRGRFRTFLLNSLDNFVLSEIRKANSKARSPEGGFCPQLPEGSAELARSCADPFVAHWAQSVIEETLRRMEAECLSAGNAARWGVFQLRALRPMLDRVAAVSYEEVVKRLGFQSPADASNALTAAKRMFQRQLREVVGEYAGAGADVDEEIRDLRRELSRSK